MDLLNPHFFNQDELIQILSERHLNINNLSKKTFSELLELYYNFVMPLHQRTPHRKDEIINGTSMNSIIKLNSNHRLKDKNCSDNKDVPKCHQNAYKHKRIEFSSDAAPVDSGEVPKKLKIMNGIRIETSKTPTRMLLKRPIENNIDSPSKHKKITWP